MLDLTIDPAITVADLEAAHTAPVTDYDVIFAVLTQQLEQDDLEELGAGLLEPATPREALAHARGLSRSDVYVGVGYCLRTVRQDEFEIGALYPDAETAWHEAEHKHRTTNPLEIPRGAVPFWTNQRFGHVALGAGGGMCWTTDYRRPGYVDLAPIAALGRWCGGQLVGWAEDVNGVDLWPSPRPKPERFTIEDRIALVRRALKRARENEAPTTRVEGLDAWLARLEARRDRKD